MFESTRHVDEVKLGFDLDSLYMRVDPGPDAPKAFAGLEIRMRVEGADETRRVDIDPADGSPVGTVRTEAGDPVDAVPETAFDDALEIRVPFELLDLTAGDAFRLVLTLRRDGMQVERHPSEGSIELTVPDETFEMRHWMV